MLCTSFFVLALMPLQAEKVGLLIVATGRYIEFAKPLINSAKKHFLTDHEVTYFVFTDSPPLDMENVVTIPHEQVGWPYDSMMRFYTYAKHKDLLQKQDYLFACDADMLFVSNVSSKILSTSVATLSPGFVNQRGSYETNPLSCACVLPTEGEHYFAGGFYGGKASEVLKLCQINSDNIDRDLRRGIIAVWHDESHLNRYFIDHPPTRILTPAYCYPESWNLPYPKRLLALDKNHSEYRK
jgi:histo-blood group ABO system transferase